MPKLSTLLFTCTIVMGSLTTVQAQKAPVRKPVTRTTTAKPATPQVEPVLDMLQLSKLEYLTSIDDYLTARNWRFSKSKPGEQEDNITYLHQSPNGNDDFHLHIYFCNKADNKYCDKPQIHEGDKSQHFYSGIISVDKSLYDNQKSKLKTIMKPIGSTTRENSITSIFKEGSLKFSFTVDNSTSQTLYIIAFQSLPETKTEEIETTE